MYLNGEPGTRIIHSTDTGMYVRDNGKDYTVFRPDGLVAISDSAYPHDEDGLSCAVARCNYLANHS